VKNGRISKYKCILANVLNIKSLLYGSEARGLSRIYINDGGIIISF